MGEDGAELTSQEEVIRILLQSEDIDVNEVRRVDYASALYLAAFEGYTRIVRLLSEDNRTDFNHETSEVNSDGLIANYDLIRSRLFKQ